MEFELAYPIDHEGQQIKALTLRRPKSRDLEVLESRKGGNAKLTNAMLADLAGVNIEVIRELDTEDMSTIAEWLEPLLDRKGRRSQSDGD